MTSREEVWIAGGGPSGAVAAAGLAAQGWPVRLFERSRFPRGKVCGCCLNGRALATLDRLGLREAIESCGPVPLHSVEVFHRSRRARLDFRGGVALSREAMDWALLRAAAARGVKIHEGVSLKAGPAGSWQTEATRSTAGESPTLPDAQIQPRWCLLADGLNSQLVPRASGSPPGYAPQSYIGAGVVLPADEPGAADLAPGVVWMALGAAGYLGVVRLEDGRVDLAAALNQQSLAPDRALGQVLAELFQEGTGRAWPKLRDAAWRGTPRLTRRPGRVAGAGWLALGDASGYIEPFTGEGMSWAIQSGALAADWLPGWLESTRAADPALAWQAALEGTLGAQRQRCRWLTRGLRWNGICSLGIRILQVCPFVARPWIRLLHRGAKG